ncbi:hypothetical protein M9H77_27495 [Catharanthus roseus]|uniref:Uncharacterized protein n=1 Tax=Catharanthus roseus TaxID=4058 RepID=A0ACC0AE46_CATRO|nr:hypothetical protein M9H77_27495 [Catharanthus roseus]
MGRWRCFLLLLSFISPRLLLSHGSATAGKTSGICISPGGRFPPFHREGKPPTRVSKGSRDLNLCRVFRKRTCCDRTQTLPAFLTIRRLASTGEATQECLQLWELLECSICDPRVGVKPGPPVICASLCDRVYEACSNAYFSMDVNTQVLAPCGLSDFVCGRASEWISNGTELCRIAGFSVMKSDDPEEPLCYGGKATTDYIADSWKASQSGVPFKTEGSGMIEDFKQWVESIPFVERVSWAVGGMVLTAGLIFARSDNSLNGVKSFYILCTFLSIIFLSLMVKTLDCHFPDCLLLHNVFAKCLYE